MAGQAQTFLSLTHESLWAPATAPRIVPKWGWHFRRLNLSMCQALISAVILN